MIHPDGREYIQIINRVMLRCLGQIMAARFVLPVKMGMGIITSIDSVGFNAVNQNYAGRSYCTQNWFHVRCLACAIRPNFISDTTPPTISNVRITDVNADGYTVVCNVSDNVGISKVEFPSWNTDKHRGEDANWIQGSVSGNTASARISLSSLKSGAVQGNYVTHIYAVGFIRK